MTGAPRPKADQATARGAALFKTTGKYRPGDNLIRVKSAHFRERPLASHRGSY